MRVAFVDVETTGLVPRQDRIVEIAVAVAEDRKVVESFSSYVKPPIRMTAGASEVNGITDEFLADKSQISEVWPKFVLALKDAVEIVIHNAEFDDAFLKYEADMLGAEPWSRGVKVTCSLKMARRLRPGKRNNLDRLCKAYGVQNRRGEHHGALADALMLADVYHAMTCGQVEMAVEQRPQPVIKAATTRSGLLVIRPSAEELSAHESFIKKFGTAHF